VVQPRILVEEDFLGGEEEHGREVALVFVDYNDINAVLDFKIDRVLIGHVLLDLVLFVAVELERGVVILGPNFTDF